MPTDVSSLPVEKQYGVREQEFIEELVQEVDRALDEKYLLIAGNLMACMSVVLGKYADRVTFDPSNARLFLPDYAPLNISTYGWWTKIVERIRGFCEKDNDPQIAWVLSLVHEEMSGHVITRARSPRSTDLMMKRHRS